MAYIGHNASGNFTTKPSKDTFSGDGSTTAFTLSEGATTNTVDVFVENVRQEPTTAYSVNGTTLTFTEAPGSGTNNIYVVNRGPLQLSATHPAAQALAASTGTFTGDLTVDTNTLHVDSTNNRVGIGTSSPDSSITVSGASKVFSTTANNSITISVNTTSTYAQTITLNDVGLAFDNNSSLRGYTFSNNGSERIRIDSSGRLLVGKTTNAIGTAGHNFNSDGFASHTRDGNYPLGVNRLSDDGDLMKFFRAGSEVAAITVDATDNIAFGATDSGGGGFYYFSGSGAIPIILPAKENAPVDNEVDLGRSVQRFQDAFVVNGVTTSSDQNEKQQIASLTSAEIAAAKRISARFKTFKWNSAVTKKGDSARTHTGVIAQEVRTALEAEGLDAGNYAFFMSNTWWEKDVEVPAVEADEENGIKAKDAFTRIDVYETEDEAPEGATKVTRLGIRYPELLAFVGAATEQRLADIETRLTALEAE